MELRFTKMEGIGNDYVYFDGINQNIPLDKDFIKKISDRHFGIGSDGMIVVLNSNVADFKMRMFNQDGSEAMMCGNGIRCFAKFCYDNQLTNEKKLKIETKSGIREVELIFDGNEISDIRVNMGNPILKVKDIPCIYSKEELIDEVVEIGDQLYNLTAISMGNPHVVTFVDDLDINLEKIGPIFEHHAMFPNSVNTEFVQVINSKYIKMRVWERGSGETKACGTGACAASLASYLKGYTDKEVTVELLGGCLRIEYINDFIYMSGPATNVFKGIIEI